jgi:hypothetical protein
MEKFIANLKKQAEENPVLVLGVTAALLTAVSKLLDSNTARSSAKTHTNEINRRIAMQSLK